MLLMLTFGGCGLVVARDDSLQRLIIFCLTLSCSSPPAAVAGEMAVCGVILMFGGYIRQNISVHSFFDAVVVSCGLFVVSAGGGGGGGGGMADKVWLLYEASEE